VGKTSLAQRFARDEWSNYVATTVGLAFQQKQVVVDGCALRLDIWDTAGQERYSGMAPLYFQDVAAAILVCSVTDADSVADMMRWARELKSHQRRPVVFAVACNKMDLAAATGCDISREAVAEFAASIGAPVFETSAKQDLQISELFEEVARRLVRAHLRESASRGLLDSTIVQKRVARIRLCETHWLYGSCALQPQLWLRGGVQGKIQRQKAKLPPAVVELIERRPPESCC